MKTIRNQRGSSHLIALLAVAVIVIISFAGYRVLKHSSDTIPIADNSTTATATAVPATIKSKADIQRASTALDKTPIDSDVNPDQLDNDLNSLL